MPRPNRNAAPANYTPDEVTAVCRRWMQRNREEEREDLILRDRKVLTPLLLELLRTADDETATLYLHALRWQYYHQRFEGFIPALQGVMERAQDRLLRIMAVQLLGSSEDATALPFLLSLLDEADPVLRMELLWAIGRINDPSAAPALRRWAGTPDARARYAAIEALRRWNDPADRALFEAAQDDPSWSVRAVAWSVRPLPRTWNNTPQTRSSRDDHVVRELYDDAQRFDLAYFQAHLSAELEPDPEMRALARRHVRLLEYELPPQDPRRRFRWPDWGARLVPYDPELSRVGLKPAPLPCPGCGGGGHELLHVPGEALGRPGRPVRLIRCQECIFEGPHSVLWRDGEPIRIEPDGWDIENFHGKLEGRQLSLRWEPNPPPTRSLEEYLAEYGADRGPWFEPFWGWDPIAGTEPYWLQSEEWPACLLCREDMQFVLQLPSAMNDFPSEPEGLAQDFYLVFEYGATFYLFECPTCQVTASVSQCT